jgi:coenzyme PQQ biosynthesis protein PqqD
LTPIDPARVPCRIPGYAAEQIDGELLLYHSGRTTVVYLNQTALMIWQLCDGRRSAADIADLLAAAFPGERAAIADDVVQALQHLVEQGVVALA